MENKGGAKCKPHKQKLSGEQMDKELEGYEFIQDYSKLKLYDRVKYIRKDTGKLVRGGLVILVNKNEQFIVIQGFVRDYKTCEPIRFSVKLSDILLFKKISDDEEGNK